MSTKKGRKKARNADYADVSEQAEISTFSSEIERDVKLPDFLRPTRYYN